MKKMPAAALRERLQGALIPAVPAPFDAAGAPHPAAEARLARYHAAGPAAGVALWVHTGRGLRLESGLRREVFRRWRAALRPEQFIIAGVGLPEARAEPAGSLGGAIEAAVGMAEEAREAGADGLLVHPPTWLRGGAGAEPAMIAYHEALGGVGPPLILFYLYEAAGGVSYDLGLLERLLRLPNVAGIKVATLDSIMTFQDIARLIEARAPEVALLTGEDRFFGATLMRGAVGALIGLAAVRPGPQAELIDCARRGRWGRFVPLSRGIDRLAESIFIAPMEGYIRRLMLALAVEGVLPMEATYDPWGPEVGEGALGPIREALRQLERLEGDEFAGWGRRPRRRQGARRRG